MGHAWFRRWSRKGLVLLWALAGAVAAAPWAFLLYFRVWPEVVVPAYMVARGLMLYRDVWVLHTPLLMLATTAAGWAFGFEAATFRALAATALAATGALLVLGVGSRHGRLVGLLIGVPLFVLWTVYTEGPTLWPDHAVAPLALGAALALERWDRTGRPRPLVVAGLLLGTAVMTKQTAAWLLFGALAYALARRRPRAALALGALAAVPYAMFAVLWLAAGTAEHLRWTLLIPLTGGFRGGHGGLPELAEFIAPLLAVAAAALFGRTGPASWLAVAAYMMAWPRLDLEHTAAANGLLALLASRAAQSGFDLWRSARTLRGPAAASRLAAGSTALAAHVAVAILGAGSLLIYRFGGPAYPWDDPGMRETARAVRVRVPKDGRFLNFGRSSENVYALTGTLPPDDTYADPTFWYLIDDRVGVEDRTIRALERRRRTLVLWRENEGDEGVRETRLYRHIRARTVLREVHRGVVWLTVAGGR